MAFETLFLCSDSFFPLTAASAVLPSRGAACAKILIIPVFQQDQIPGSKGSGIPAVAGKAVVIRFITVFVPNQSPGFPVSSGSQLSFSLGHNVILPNPEQVRLMLFPLQTQYSMRRTSLFLFISRMNDSVFLKNTA